MAFKRKGKVQLDKKSNTENIKPIKVSIDNCEKHDFTDRGIIEISKFKLKFYVHEIRSGYEGKGFVSIGFSVLITSLVGLASAGEDASFMKVDGKYWLVAFLVLGLAGIIFGIYKIFKKPKGDSRDEIEKIDRFLG